MASNSKDEIMTIEAKEALASARATDFKKKVNAASWSPHMETLMKTWGEKSTVNYELRFLIHFVDRKSTKSLLGTLSY